MPTARDALLVFLGGGIGSVLRFLVASALPKTQSFGFPLAILVVNVVGCFVLGGLVGYALLKDEPQRTLLTFVGVGICGGFTTFSTFGVDALELLREGRVPALCAYVGLSVMLGIAAAFAGFKAWGAFA